MNNIERALQLVDRRRPARGKREAFIVSVLQSALFNCWLTERIERSQYRTILDGDVVQKTDTGGLFVVEDVAEATARFEAGTVVYTGPMFGPKMMAPAAQAARYEQRLLDVSGLDLAVFKRLRAPGARRRAVLRIDDLAVRPEADGLRFTFTLPPGAYATMVMREFLRNPDRSSASA